MGLSVQERFEQLRARLDKFGYRQPLGIESLALAEQLFADLLATTASLKHEKERRLETQTSGHTPVDDTKQHHVSKENQHGEIKDDDRESPYRRDNARLMSEVNTLHRELIRRRDVAEMQTRKLKLHLRQLDHEAEDLRFLNSQYLQRINELEQESALKSERIARLVEKEAQAVVEAPDGKKKRIALHRQRMKVSALVQPTADRDSGDEPEPSQPSRPSSQQIDLLKAAEKRVEELEQEHARLNADMTAYETRAAALEAQVSRRDKEIQRLSAQLEGGRPIEVIRADGRKITQERRIAQLEAQVEYLHETNRALQDEVLDATKAAEDAHAQRENIVASGESMRREIQQLERALNKLEREREADEASATRLADKESTKVTHLRQLLRDKSREAADLSLKVEALKDVNRKLKERLSKSHDDHDNVAIPAVEDRSPRSSDRQALGNDELIQRLEALSADNENLRTLLRHADERANKSDPAEPSSTRDDKDAPQDTHAISRLRQQVHELKASLEQEKKLRTSLQTEKDQLTVELQQLKTASNTGQQHEALAAQLQQSEMKLAACQRQVESMSLRIRQLSSDAETESLKMRIKSLQEDVVLLQETNSNLTRQAETMRTENRSLQLERDDAIAHSESLAQQLVQAQEEARRWRTRAREHHLHSHQAVGSDADALSVHSLHRPESWGGSDTVTLSSTHDSPASRRSLQQVQDEFSRYVHRCQDLETELAEHKRQAEQRAEESERLRKALQDLDREMDSLQTALDNKEQTIEELQHRLHDSDTTRSHALTRIDALVAELQSAQAQVDDMARQRDSLARQLDQRTESEDDIRQRAVVAEDALASAQRDLDTLTEECQQVYKERDTYLSQRDQYRLSLDMLDERIASMDRTIQQREAEVQHLQQTCNALRQELVKAQQSHPGGSQDTSSTSAQRNLMEQREAAMQEALQTLVQEVQRLREQLAAYDQSSSVAYFQRLTIDRLCETLASTEEWELPRPAVGDELRHVSETLREAEERLADTLLSQTGADGHDDPEQQAKSPSTPRTGTAQPQHASPDLDDSGSFVHDSERTASSHVPKSEASPSLHNQSDRTAPPRDGSPGTSDPAQHQASPLLHLLTESLEESDFSL